MRLIVNEEVNSRLKKACTRQVKASMLRNKLFLLSLFKFLNILPDSCYL